MEAHSATTATAPTDPSGAAPDAAAPAAAVRFPIPVPPPAPWQRRKRETRARLEEVGLRLFVERGFDEVTVDELAEAAEIGRRTFFRYFPSKSDIVFGAIDGRGQILLSTLVAAARRGHPPVESVRRAFQSANAYGPEDHPWLAMRIWLIGRTDSLRAHAAILFREWEEGIRVALEEHQRELAGRRLYADVLARASIAAMWAAYDAWLRSGAGRDLPDHIDQALDALGGAFVPPAGPAPEN